MFIKAEFDNTRPAHNQGWVNKHMYFKYVQRRDLVCMHVYLWY